MNVTVRIKNIIFRLDKAKDVVVVDEIVKGSTPIARYLLKLVLLVLPPQL